MVTDVQLRNIELAEQVKMLRAALEASHRFLQRTHVRNCSERDRETSALLQANGAALRATEP